MGFPDGSASKESACNAGDLGSIPRVRKIPWRRKWQPTQVSLPGKFHGQRRLHGVAKSWTQLSDNTNTSLDMEFYHFFLLVHIACIVSHDKSAVTLIFIPPYINAPSPLLPDLLSLIFSR